MTAGHPAFVSFRQSTGVNGRVVARTGAAESPAPELEDLGGSGSAPSWCLVCGDRDEPILPDRWPSFDQIATVIKDRDETAADRDAARERLKEMGLDPAWTPTAGSSRSYCTDTGGSSPQPGELGQSWGHPPQYAS